jgi:hypothetical protein
VHRNGDYKRRQQAKQVLLGSDALRGKEELGLKATGLERILVGQQAQPCCVKRQAQPRCGGRRPRRLLVG